MIEKNWLLSYKDIAGIEKPLERISWRFTNSNPPLISPIDELVNNYESFEIDLGT